MRITWLGHSSVKVETSSVTIYIDPYAGSDSDYKPNSVVLVSRFHFDHCNVSKVRLAAGDEGHIIGTKEVVANIFPAGLIRPGESKFFGDVEIVGVQARKRVVDYRSHDNDISDIVGFVIVDGKKKVYYMADSDFLPQFTSMKPDVLLIAVGGTYTQNAKEAARSVELIDPKLVIPIHWGGPVGHKDDALLFSEIVKCPVKVLEDGESVEV